MIPNPPPTPRLNDLLSTEDDDPLWGSSPGAVAILAQLRTSLAGKGASLQPLEDVPLIHTTGIMEHFGFKRRPFYTHRSFKYISGWPAFTTPKNADGAFAPVRGRQGWGVHPALSYS